MTEPLYEAVAARLRENIHAGALSDGERVPSVRAMSRQVGVSIGTVVQAYQQLEAQGVIVARPQSGYYVRHTELPGITRKPGRMTPKPRPPSALVPPPDRVPRPGACAPRASACPAWRGFPRWCPRG